MPGSVITRARAILEALEHDELTRGGRPSISGTPVEPQQQLGLFQIPPPVDPVTENVVRRLREIDTNNLTPLASLMLLAELKRELES
jgi:DNA mismatch repair ATPase MutS